MKKWKQISSKLAFDHTWFKVRQDTVELPNGKVLDDFFVWLEGDVVIVVPVRNDGKFVLVRQYKHAASDIVIEFPAGMISENEPPEKAALRELQEETGYTGSDIELLSVLKNHPTKVVSNIYVYLVKEVTDTGRTSFDENENIEVLLKSADEIDQMIQSGEIQVTGTISAFLLACRKLNLIKSMATIPSSHVA